MAENNGASTPAPEAEIQELERQVEEAEAEAEELRKKQEESDARLRILRESLSLAGSKRNPSIVLHLVGGAAPQPSDIVGEFPPTLLPGAFRPSELVGCPVEHWTTMLLALAKTLPVQMHFEPQTLGSARVGGTPDNSVGPPSLFQRTVQLLDGYSELDDLMGDKSDTETRGRIKFRLSGGGKFVHRNRYERRNIICCLSGEQHWLLLDTSVGARKDDSDGTLDGGAVDAYLEAQQNKNWNGYRSHKWSSMLSVDQMKEIAKNAPPGVTAKVIRVKAGDVFTFDGRWWHATSYNSPVLSLFFTPGPGMEVALEQHKKRMAMPLQEGLKLATINLAKCSKLSGSWKKNTQGESTAACWAEDMDKAT